MMKKNPDISVIMGVYNPTDIARFHRAVDSILKQTFQNWELILYDDGSKAPYAAEIRKMEKIDERIRCLRSEDNRGLSHALNEGIRESSGQYLARMDDDDISVSTRFEKQYDFLEKYKEYQWIGSNAELMDGKGVWGLQCVPEIPQNEDFLFNSPYIHPTVMFRREILLHSGGYSISKDAAQCEDYELFMRLHKGGARGYNIQEPLLQYWEDYDSYKKRTYRRRIREMKVRRRGFKELELLSRTNYYYVVKPLIVGAVPAPVHHYIRRRLKGRRKKDERNR